MGEHQDWYERLVYTDFGRDRSDVLTVWKTQANTDECFGVSAGRS
jgi:hypothetical protein